MYGHLAKNGSMDGIGNVDLLEAWESVQAYRDQHDFFHWALAFPEVMNAERGFHTTVGNPPWDAVKPKLDEFFAPYAPGIGKMRRTEKDSIVAAIEENNPDIARRWETYCRKIEEQATYFKEGAFSLVGSGDVNTYKLFIEQNLSIAGVSITQDGLPARALVAWASSGHPLPASSQ